MVGSLKVYPDSKKGQFNGFDVAVPSLGKSVMWIFSLVERAYTINYLPLL